MICIVVCIKNHSISHLFYLHTYIIFIYSIFFLAYHHHILILPEAYKLFKSFKIKYFLISVLSRPLNSQHE